MLIQMRRIQTQYSPDAQMTWGLRGLVYESVEELNMVVVCRLLVSAPWSGYDQNKKGDVYKCQLTGSRNSCDRLNLQGKPLAFYHVTSDPSAKQCPSNG